MPKVAYVALGSNTTIKSGAGTLYGVAIGGAAGGTFVALDSVSIGNAPDYNAIGRSVPSNLAILPGLAATPSYIDLPGRFSTGLTVAATSNADLSIFYD